MGQGNKTPRESDTTSFPKTLRHLRVTSLIESSLHPYLTNVELQLTLEFSIEPGAREEEQTRARCKNQEDQRLKEIQSENTHYDANPTKQKQGPTRRRLLSPNDGNISLA